MTLIKDLMKAAEAARKSILENMSAATELTGGTNPFGDETLVLDMTSEESVIDVLRESNTSIAFLTEEQGVISQQKKPEYLVVIDGIDGSANLERQIPLCSIGISAIPYSDNMITDDIEISIVSSVFTEETYVAVTGKGVKKNGISVKVAEPVPIGESLISYDTKKPWDNDFSSSSVRVLSAVKDMRRSASNLLDLCWVASGSLDAMVDLRDELPIVHVSGTHIVFEAGGFVVDCDGHRLNLPIEMDQKMSFVAASNEGTARDILRIFKGNLL
ncbi:MAG: inositol monophosphatase family protein [Candidatus Thorarchaeota archaeon]